MYSRENSTRPITILYKPSLHYKVLPMSEIIPFLLRSSMAGEPEEKDLFNSYEVNKMDILNATLGIFSEEFSWENIIIAMQLFLPIENLAQVSFIW